MQQIVYLGVVASYTGLQTFRHRQKAAAQNRRRLLKLLHTRQLSLSQRFRLYRACVVSSQLYGLHATGVNAQILRELEAADVRALRAIAKSPAHLYYESTVSLRKRLKVESPTTTLRLVLQRRCSGANDQQLKKWFELQLQILNDSYSMTSTSQELHLTPAGIPGVACPVCGITCINRRHMLSHQGRNHRPTTVTADSDVSVAGPRRSGEWYMQHAARGMPQCRHCNRLFTRFEGFKKHLRQACPVLHGQPNPPRSPPRTEPCNPESECTTELTVKVASAREESEGPTPQLHSTTLATEDSLAAAGALMHDGNFRSSSQQHWQSVLRVPEYCKSMST